MMPICIYVQEFDKAVIYEKDPDCLIHLWNINDSGPYICGAGI